MNIKPCPFCGGKAVYNEKEVCIECSKCKASIYGVKALKRIASYSVYLASLWNRRAEE